MAETQTAAQTGMIGSAKGSDDIIQINGMHKWYGDFHVLKDINLSVKSKERIVICGPSGSGKSTLIRCINRLEEHQKGDIYVNGIELTNDLKNIDLIRREVGMVFQHFNLFPHLTVLENCTLGPIWVRQTPKTSPCSTWSGSRSPNRRSSSLASFRAASSNAWPSRARSA